MAGRVALQRRPHHTARLAHQFAAGNGRRLFAPPPPNTTGDFVTVAQRVPVKLLFERGENSRRLLVPGMSVVATIELH
jgi:membrane fusion protein (multidrug efflux system)